MKNSDKESYGVWITAGDYNKKKETVHRTKHATQDKTQKRWCRNCFRQVKLSDL
jgi:predicted adenine nucleotide alpha hydrolase (AANH) superfamily ATPase